MTTSEQATRARNEVVRLLHRFGWQRGIGLTLTPNGQDAIMVQVQRQEHVPMARSTVGGDTVWGVPVIYEAVGDFYALASVKMDGKPVVGFGDGTVSTPAPTHPSPWVMGIATSVVGAAVGWAIEEVAVHFRRRRR